MKPEATHEGNPIELAVLKSHCAREPKGADHTCLGKVEISREGITLACPLCGPAAVPNQNHPYGLSVDRARAILSAAGITWTSLSSEAMIAAATEAARDLCPGCQQLAVLKPDSYYTCRCGEWVWYQGWKPAKEASRVSG